MSDQNDIEQQERSAQEKGFTVSGKVYILTVTGLIVLALGLGLGLGLGLKDNGDDKNTNQSLAFQNDLSWMAEPVSLPSNLWSGENGVYGGYTPAEIPGGLSYDTMVSLYGKSALDKATVWAKEGRALYCSTAEDPDAEPPLAGIFPFQSPPTTSTYWPNACPNSQEAQNLFDKGLAWRMLFNDN